MSAQAPGETAEVSLAYRRQALDFAASGLAVAGWKIAATSAKGQAHLGLTGPIYGRLNASQIFASGIRLSLVRNGMRLAEPEFAFRFGHTLPPQSVDYTVAEIKHAVASIHPALEIPDSRYADLASADAAALIRDNACAHQLVVGDAAAAAAWRDIDLATVAVHAGTSGGARYDGSGAAVLGDPWLALAWLVNSLRARGEQIASGAVVTTGVTTQPIPATPGSSVTAKFGAFGSVTVRFDIEAGSNTGPSHSASAFTH